MSNDRYQKAQNQRRQETRLEEIEMGEKQEPRKKHRNWRESLWQIEYSNDNRSWSQNHDGSKNKLQA